MLYPLFLGPCKDGIIEIKLLGPSEVFLSENTLRRFLNFLTYIHERTNNCINFIKGLILSSDNPDYFCKGIDNSTHLLEQQKVIYYLFHKAIAKLLSLNIPIVVAINGITLAEGSLLALSCDFRISYDNNTTCIKLTNFNKLTPGLIALLKKKYQKSTWLDLMLYSKRYDSVEALNCGLIDNIVPREKLTTSVFQFILSITTLSTVDTLEMLKKKSLLYSQIIALLDTFHQELLAEYLMGLRSKL